MSQEKSEMFMKRLLDLSTVRRTVGLTMGAVLIAGTSAFAQPFTTPGGVVWDCTLSGHRTGLAQLLFTAPDEGSAGTLFAFELIIPKNQSTSPNEATDSRGGSGDSRQGTGNTNSTGSSTITNLFGAALFTGQWNFDAKGRIIGNL